MTFWVSHSAEMWKVTVLDFLHGETKRASESHDTEHMGLFGELGTKESNDCQVT